jgi:hypothetical protein
MKAILSASFETTLGLGDMSDMAKEDDDDGNDDGKPATT